MDDDSRILWQGFRYKAFCLEHFLAFGFLLLLTFIFTTLLGDMFLEKASFLSLDRLFIWAIASLVCLFLLKIFIINRLKIKITSKKISTYSIFSHSDFYITKHSQIELKRRFIDHYLVFEKNGLGCFSISDGNKIISIIQNLQNDL